MITNCPNCGAPLHGYKCDYCGTEIPELRGQTITIEQVPHGTVTLAAKVAITMDAVYSGRIDHLNSHITHELSRQLVNAAAEHIRLDTWRDLHTDTQVVGATLKVVIPEK